MMTLLLACYLLATAQSPPAPILPTTTVTKFGNPGDPVNLLLVGTRPELLAAFRDAGWFVADPITLRSSLRIGASVALTRPYPAAPVSDLYLFGRVQDVAFESAVGPSARCRHHVRFWEAGTGEDGRSVWAGAGTFDARVGRSPATGRMTHRIAADVDAERDAVVAALRTAGGLAGEYTWARGGPAVGRNGGGDWYYTDGAVGVCVLRTGCPTTRAGGPQVAGVVGRGR
jgi:LssY C-terminus